MNKWYNDRLEYKQDLDKIGHGFCTAKWSQVTVHLGTGHNHSCHHPRTHFIPIEEIVEDPSALHNTKFKKDIRRQMLNGERPTECDYCWKVEDAGEPLSDRVLKSYEPWSRGYFERFIKAGSDENVDPTYLEVSFSNVCNFKCSYCSPDVSSQWMEEIKQHGPYPTSIRYNNIDWIQQQDKMPIPEREYNPYVEAFWKWWPDLYKNLHTFRITGGEPLLSKHTFRVLDYIIENPNKNLELSINSNFCVPDDIFEKFLSKLEIIQEKKLVKHLVIFTSCEAAGPKAEYIRHGLNYGKWYSNCNLFLERVPNAKLGIMSTYNALSVTSYTDFLKDMWLLNYTHSRKKWYQSIASLVSIGDTGRHPLILDIPYLNNPPHQTVGILTSDYIPQIQASIEYMNANKEFYKSETQKLERLLKVFEPRILDNNPSKIQHRKDFVSFVDEHDKRRGTNFLSTFPEMTNFYNLCKSY